MTPAAQIIDQARRQWLADDHEAALDSFRQAMGVQPDDLRLAVEVANYLGMRFEIDEAVAILTRCEQALLDNLEGLFQVGLAYERSFQPNDSLRCFRHVLSNAPNHIASRVKIAEWHERRNQLQDGWDILAPCQDELDVTGKLRLWRGKLSRRMKDVPAAQSTLIALTESNAVDQPTLIDTWYELAALYDGQGHADRAFDAAMQAKELQKRGANPHLRRAMELAKLEASFVNSVSRDHFERWARDAHHVPVALLTGPPRSGTSMMARMIGMHPAVKLADELDVYATYVHKEMLTGGRGTSAGDVLDAVTEHQLANCRDQYTRWMSAVVGQLAQDQVLLDKNPSTTCLIPAFRRLFPRSVIIVAIRDPRDVVMSCFLQQLELNPVSAMFNELRTTVMRCRAEMSAWLRIREKLTPPWCELRYEELAAGDDHSLQDAVRSMGLERQSDVRDFRSSLVENPVRSPTYAQLFEPINTHSIGRWKRYQKQLEPYLSQLEPLCQALGYE